MPRLSRATRETIQTIAVVVAVIILILVFVVYPLNRIRVMMGRSDDRSYKPDSLPPNDITSFVNAGLNPDSFHIETDGLTKLAAVYWHPAEGAPPRGLAILIPDERSDRTSFVALAGMLRDSGLAVVAYDPRATGLSSGKYHGEGQYESSDLEAIVGYLEIHGKLVRPLVVVGRELGAEAAMLAQLEEERMDGVLAIRPYLTTGRLIDKLTVERGIMWFPFRAKMLWWWYNIRSGYAAPFRGLDAIKPVRAATRVLIDASAAADPELTKLREVSSPELLTIKTVETGDSVLFTEILELMQSASQKH